MKRFLFFLIFFLNIFVNCLHAENNTIFIDGNDKNGLGNIRLTILRPCVVSTITTTNNKNEINDTINTEEQNNITNENSYTDVFSDEYDKSVEEDIDKKIDKINDMISSVEKKASEQQEKTVFDFYTGNAKNEKILDYIYNRIISNLRITKLYNIDYNRNFCSEITNFFNSKNVNDITDYIFSGDFDYSDYVLSAELEILNENEIKIQLFLWDILDQKFLDGKYYILKVGKIDNSYRISNMISDFIFKTTTGENSGLFDSKIIYVSETGSPLKREKQIAIMNFDGSKNTKITKNKNMKLTPIFSRVEPDEIFYMEYLPDGAFMVKHELSSGKITKILTKNQNMTSSASFNPNGENQIILAGTKGRATNLFLFDFKEKINRQITNNSSINTAPNFNPTGDKIVYVSDRSGSRKLYVKDLKTDEDKLLTKNIGVYDKPAWSPDGKLIAFIKLKGGKFHLGIMTYTGEAERILTSSYLIEGVKWSPNSRYLIYTKQVGPYGADSIPKIYIKDILTGNEYKLNTPKQEGASDPDWIMNK